jgi:hypothetical protein
MSYWINIRTSDMFYKSGTKGSWEKNRKGWEIYLSGYVQLRRVGPVYIGRPAGFCIVYEKYLIRISMGYHTGAVVYPCSLDHCPRLPKFAILFLFHIRLDFPTQVQPFAHLTEHILQALNLHTFLDLFLEVNN